MTNGTFLMTNGFFWFSQFSQIIALMTCLILVGKIYFAGAFVVYNFANAPFSLGVGGQYGPQLREITIDTGEAVNVNSWRFPMAFFTIDVPFFNLHTGARKIIVN